MSVPTGARTEGKLKVAERALEFAAYTLQITKNPKIFDPQQNSGFIDEIRRLAIMIHSKVWAANGIYVKTQKDAEQRLRLQKSARVDCNAIMPLIQLAGKVFHLKYKRIKYWGEFAIDVRKRIKSWEDSDRKRYDQMFR